MLKCWMQRGNSLFILVFFLLITCSAPVLAQQSSIYKDLQWPFYDPGGDICETDSVTPGNGAPDGAEFPKLNASAMAGAINTWIVQKNPNSKLKSLGSTIVSGAKNSNVSPFLIVAIAAQESSMADPDDWNVSHANNAFGRTATPTQPNVQGAKLWYKWMSVKASVDYTADENKGAEGGGDIAAYIRNVYSDELKSSNLLALFLKYAPAGDRNNPQDYAAKVQSWIDELVSLTGEAGETTNSGSTSSGCDGIAGGSIAETAVGFAWPNGSHGPNKTDATSAYQYALPKYNSATSDYSDCGGFVATVMHASKADEDYVGVYVPSQYTYISKASKYRVVESVRDTSQLQPGDILIYINPSNPPDSHTFIYVGRQSGFDGDSAGASLGGHVPEAVNAAASFAYSGRAASGNYLAARLVQ